MIYASAIRGPYGGKVVAAAFVSGAVVHALLFSGYALYKAGVFGDAGLLVFAAMIGFMPIVLAAIGSRFFKREQTVPVYR